MGCVIQAAQGQIVARQASIKAGLPIEVPAITINVVCGSGLKCVNDAATTVSYTHLDVYKRQAQCHVWKDLCIYC